MVEYTTIRVTKEAHARGKEQKEQAGRTWNEQIVRPEDGGGEEAVLQELDRLEAKVERLADGVAATGGDAGGGTDDELVARLEDIRSELPRAVAQELQA